MGAIRLAAGFTPEYAARLDDHYAALALVGAGLGITVLPRLALAHLPEGLVVRPLVQPEVGRRIVVHASRDPRRNHLVRASLAVLQARARSET